MAIFAVINTGDHQDHYNDGMVKDAANWAILEAGTAALTFDHIHLTGGQIGFPATQSASADANTLDDYEEGTWTPGVSFGAGTTGITYTTQTGVYTKIGRVVNVSAYIVLSAKGSDTGAALITGLPFAVASSRYPAAVLKLANITFANQYSGYGNASTTTIVLNETTEAGSMTSLLDSDFANNSIAMLSLTYSV
jgi:hypothetical protein